MHIDKIHIFDIGGQETIIETKTDLQDKILKAIPSDHHKTAAMIASETSIARRAVMRIISELRGLGIPIIGNRKGETGLKIAVTQNEIQDYASKTAQRIRKEYIGLAQLRKFGNQNLKQTFLELINLSS